MTTISIKVDDSQLRQAMNRAPGVVKSKLGGWVNRSAARSERSAKENLTRSVSRGSSGRTRASIQIMRSGSLSAEVKPTTKASLWVHEGRGPGRMPPWREGSDLNMWARRMGINPFLVARAIARKGTKGHPFMTQAYRDVKGPVDRDAEATLADIVRSI